MDSKSDKIMQKIKNYFSRIPTHLIVAASAWSSRIVSALIGIISIRTLLLYLGEERYAVYAITYSLVGWFSLCDIGIGSSLQNFISESRAKNEKYDKYLKTALQMICALIIIFLAIIITLSPFIQNILFSKYLDIPEIQNINIIGIIGCILIVSALANIVYKVYYALQKGYISNILPAVSLIISMAVIIMVNKFSPVRESIIISLLAFTVPQLLTASIPFMKIFGPYFSKIFDFDKQIFKNLLVRALKFSGFTIMGIATLQIDYIIMSQTVDPSGITTYNIFNKIFILLLFIHSAVLAAAWPVCNEFFNKGLYKTIKNMLAKYVVFGFAVIIFGSFMTYTFSDLIISILAPHTAVKITVSLFILFTAYFLLRVLSDTFAMFLQSINALRIFWIYTPFQAIISIAIQYFASIKYGINGILIGLIASFVLTSCWVLPYKTWKVLKSREADSAAN